MTAAAAGASAYLLFQTLGVGEAGATLGAFVVGFGLRSAAIVFGLKLPRYQGPQRQA